MRINNLKRDWNVPVSFYTLIPFPRKRDFYLSPLYTLHNNIKWGEVITLMLIQHKQNALKVVEASFVDVL